MFFFRSQIFNKEERLCYRRSQNIAKLILFVSYGEKNMKLMSCMKMEGSQGDILCSTVTLQSACFMQICDELNYVSSLPLNWIITVVSSFDSDMHNKLNNVFLS